MDKKETSAPSWPQVIATPQAPPAIGPYSQALRVGPWLYCSGQLPLHPQEGALVGADLASQTEQALRNLQSVVEAAGGLIHVSSCILESGRLQVMWGLSTTL